MNAKVLKIVLPILLLAGGVAAVGGVMALSPTTGKGAPEARVLPVDVVEAQPQAAPAVITGSGVVSPDQEVTVIPQVAGQIVEVSDRLIPGGRFKEGEVLARIDHRDYKLALRAEDARVRAAELELALEEKRTGIARREWELLGSGKEDAALALRQPQLEVAQVNLASAMSSLERARLGVERTRLKAPFNAVVVAENVDVGQVVGASTQVARLIGTDRFRVVVSVPVEDLSAIKIPGIGGEEGSEVEIVQALGGGQRIVRHGKVLRLSGELDPQTRRAQVVVSVDSPLDGPQGGLPMLPGAFVEVEIAGRALDGVYPVPRQAVRQGKEVWIVDGESQLRRREVEIQWGDDRTAWLTGALNPGDRVVISALSLPIEGAAASVTHTVQGDQPR